MYSILITFLKITLVYSAVPEYISLKMCSINKKGVFLDEKYSDLIDISSCTFCALQEIRMPNDQWVNPKPGVTETFGPRLNKHSMYLIMLSNAVVSSDERGKSYQHSNGISINPNSGFQFSEYKTVLIDGVEKKGIVLIKGNFGDTSFVFGSIHGDWDPRHGYNNSINIEGVSEALKMIKGFNVTYYILTGDFNLSYNVMVKNLNTTWRPILPDIKMQDGPFLTVYDTDGFGNADHLLTNMDFYDYEIYYVNSDHNMISFRVNVPDFKNKKKLVQIVFPEENL